MESPHPPASPYETDPDLVVQTLAAIVQSSDDAIVAKDLNGIVTSWNPAAERLFGYRADEVIGRSILIIIPPERRHEEDEVLRRVRSGQKVDHFETERIAKDGSKRYISLTVSPIKDVSGRIVGASKIARDISVRVEAEQAVRASNELKDQFLSMVSHELRTPISVIVGNGHVLLNRDKSLLPEDRRQALVDITFQAERLQRIIENLLLLTRVEAGEKLEIDFLHLERLVERAIKTVKSRSPSRPISCEVSLEAPVFGDATLVGLVLENFIGNADKYSPEGEEIVIEVRQSPTGFAEVHVLDRGIGLNNLDLVEMFEPFYRAEIAKDHASGMGLGLAVCKKAIGEMGGAVAAAPRAGGGADFWFTLPMAAAPEYA